jgi:hypothetical protein
MKAAVSGPDDALESLPDAQAQHPSAEAQVEVCLHDDRVCLHRFNYSKYQRLAVRDRTIGMRVKPVFKGPPGSELHLV